MSRNNVRGPTSALTEFLKASGITATSITNRAATRCQAQVQAQDEAEDQPVAGPSRASNNVEDTGAEGSSSRRTRAARRASGYTSDELDEPEPEAADEDAMDVDDQEEEEKPTPAKKRKLTNAAEAKLKAKEKKKTKKKDSGTSCRHSLFLVFGRWSDVIGCQRVLLSSFF